MLSLHFNKQVFINTLNSKDSVVYGVTTLALMLTLLFQGMIKGNLKPEYFMYAMVVSFVFCSLREWTVYQVIKQYFQTMEKLLVVYFVLHRWMVYVIQIQH